MSEMTEAEKELALDIRRLIEHEHKTCSNVIEGYAMAHEAIVKSEKSPTVEAVLATGVAAVLRVILGEFRKQDSYCYPDVATADNMPDMSNLLGGPADDTN